MGERVAVLSWRIQRASCDIRDHSVSRSVSRERRERNTNRKNNNNNINSSGGGQKTTRVGAGDAVGVKDDPTFTAPCDV